MGQVQIRIRAPFEGSRVWRYERTEWLAGVATVYRGKGLTATEARSVAVAAKERAKAAQLRLPGI